jgi:peptidoglycan/LPS O-acetylase OafA/YrhL
MHQPVSQLPAGATFAPELQRQTHLDGLRGVAALIVLFGHIMIAVFPAVVTQNPNEAHTRFDQIGGFLPIAFVWNGNFGVCIFFVLSGFVLSAYAAHSKVSFLADLVRRYLRLALPIIIISTGAWLMLTLGAFSNYQAAVTVTKSGWLSGWYRFEPNFFLMAKEALYGAFATGQAAYNSNLWTMAWELPGSVYVFLCWALFKDRGIRLVALAIFIIMHIADYYVLFAAGVLLYDRGGDLIALPLRREWMAKRMELTGWCLAALGLLMGSAPYVLGSPGDGWLAAHQVPAFLRTINTAAISPIFNRAESVHEIGAITLFVGLMFSGGLKRILASKGPAFLGRISFVLYLINIPLICSVLAWVVLHLPPDMPYLARAAMATVVTTLAGLAISGLISDFVDVRMTLISRQAGRLFDRCFASGGEK